MTDTLRTTKRLPEVLCLALYTALLAFSIAHHEPWADEAQAWQIARSLTPWQILSTYLHYEGSPGLWHLFLWALIHLGVSYSGMHWICGVVAILGVALLVFYAPFPLYLRLLIPFTYYLLFQFAVVARSYVLVPILLFAVLALWKRNPVGLAVLLALLANLAAHATVMAAGIALLYFLDGRPRAGWTRKQLTLAAAVLFAGCAFALWTAWPAHDVVIASYHAPGSLPAHQSFAATFSTGALYAWLVPFFAPFWLSIPFWIAIAAVLAHARRFLLLAPIVLFAGFSGAVHVNFWHAGLLDLLLIAILWIAWDRLPHDKYRRLLEIVLTASFLVQIGWSAYAINFDRKFDYSPDLAAAEFLAPYIQHGDSIVSTYAHAIGVQDFHSVGLEPYFHQHLFLNQPLPFWLWSTSNPSEAKFLASLQNPPSIVVVDFSSPNRFDPLRDVAGEKNSLLLAHGYVLARTFCGSLPQGFHLHADICHLIYLHTARGIAGTPSPAPHP